jgi:hypothetical protein
VDELFDLYIVRPDARPERGSRDSKPAPERLELAAAILWFHTHVRPPIPSTVHRDLVRGQPADRSGRQSAGSMPLWTVRAREARMARAPGAATGKPRGRSFPLPPLPDFALTRWSRSRSSRAEGEAASRMILAT